MLLKEALRLEPGYAAARAGLAACHEIFFYWDGFDPVHIEAGLGHAGAVVTSQTEDAAALARAGFVIWQLGQDYDLALAAIEKSLSFNPSGMAALLWGGYVYAIGGEPAKASAYAERALRLSPFDPGIWMAHWNLGIASNFEERYDDALSHFAKGMQLSPPLAVMHAAVAATLASAGRADEAGPSVKRVLELDPAFRYGPVLKMIRDQALRERWREAARLAGVPI